MDLKKYTNNGFWGAMGAALGYFYSDSKNKNNNLRRKIGFLGSAGIFYASIMLFSNGLNRGADIIETKIQNETKLDSMRIEIEREKVKKGYDSSLDSIKNSVTQIQFKTEKLYSTIDGKVQGIGGEIQDIKKNQSHILESQKKLSDNLYSVKEQTTKQSSQSEKRPLYTSNYTHTSGTSGKKSLDEVTRFLIVADKSDQNLTLWDDSGNRLYQCDMIFAKSGGPDNGQYPVRAVQSRSGELYPGVTKLTDILVITGSGQSSQYDDHIFSGENVNKTGIRTYNDSYKKIESIIKGRNTEVLVRN